MGWRRAFCNGPPKPADHGGDSDQTIFKSIDPPTPTLMSSRIPRFGGRLNFFTSSSNPSTPRFIRCRTSYTHSTNPKIEKTMNMKNPKSSVLGLSTNPPSPKSPLKLSLFRDSFRSRNGCGVCGQSVKSGRGTAVYTAQCGHVFHYPCIAKHVRGTSGMKLTCLVCNVEWSDDPLLAVHQHLSPSPSSTQSIQTVNNRNSVDFEVKQVISTTKPPPQSLSLSSSAKTQFHHFQNRHVQIKCYDDDEPLFSSRTAKSVFNPIPESADVCEGRQTTIQSGVDIRLMPESALISKNSDHQTCAMVLKVKAPHLPQTARKSIHTPLLDVSRRAPIDLVTVLDVSGSMMGTKMQMMRRAMRLLISSLGPQDRLSIVSFSSVPKRLFPLRRMTPSGQRAAKCIVDRLESSQGSCVTDALMKASKVLDGRRERNSVATIILLSDGQVDHSLESERQRSAIPPLPPQCSATRFAHVEIPVISPADDTFAKLVGGLLSVVVQDLKIELGFASSLSPLAEITAVYCSERQSSLLNSNIISLGDLYAEEERELLVELQVPIAAIRQEKFLTLKCSYKDPATLQRISSNSQTFIVPQACSNPCIHRLRNVFISTRAVAESRRIVEHGEFVSAHMLLSSARALLIQSGSSMSADECVQVLEMEIMELGRRREMEQMEEQERMVSLVRRQLTESSGSTPSSTGKKMSWSRVSDLHGFENARF